MPPKVPTIVTYLQRNTLLASLCAAILASQCVVAQQPAIELSALSRLGGQVGTNFDLSISSGARTEEVDRIDFSHPGINGKLQSASIVTPFSDTTLPRFGNFHVSIADDVPPGRYEVRVQGRFGLSNSRLFLVTKEPWSEGSGGSAFASAANLPLGQLIQDECLPRQRKYYHLSLVSEQPVDIRFLTSSLDSRARLLVSLLDTSQRQVATAEVLENQDTRLEYHPVQSGTHTLVVSDHLFRGGPEYRYAVHALSADPSFAQPNLLDEWRAEAALIDASAADSGDSLITTRLTPNIATLRGPTLDASPIFHDEANFPDKQLCSIEFPSLVLGRFDTDIDQDWFEFKLEEKTPVAIEVVSDRLGERTDPQLIVYRVEKSETGYEKLTQIAIADDIANTSAGDVRLASRDAVVLFTPPESGTYRLLIRDQQRSNTRGRHHRYALELRKPNHDISAVAYFATPTRDITKSQNAAPTIPRNGTMAVAIAIARRDGWQGPVEVRVEGLPQGVASESISLASDQTHGHLVLVANQDAAANVSSISVRVTAKIDDQTIERTAIPIEIVQGPIETQKAPIARLASRLMLAVEDRDQVPLMIQFGSKDLATVQRGQKLKIPVAIQREEGGKQQVIVRLRNSPNKTKANDLTVNADTDKAEIELNIPNDAPLGEYTCWAQCESKIKLSLNPQALEREQKQLEELQSRKSQLAEGQMKDLEVAIAAQQEKIKQVQGATKMQEFLVQLPSTTTRFRIIDKP